MKKTIVEEKVTWGEGKEAIDDLPDPTSTSPHATGRSLELQST